MLYYSGLEEIIFNKHEFIEEPDELIIISGYIGPSPLKRLEELPVSMKITVIGGMYTNGIDKRLYSSIEKIKEDNPRLTVKFSTQEIHSKIYIWKKKGKTLSALIGSANFSSNGLRTKFRESLADATRDTFIPLDDYLKFIVDNSIETPIISSKQVDLKLITTTKTKSIEEDMLKLTIEIPLYKIKNEKPVVMPKSGLNWGLARFGGSHVAEGDGYIGIPKFVFKKCPGLINPYDSNYINSNSKKKRNSDPIELIWDDGTTMPASFEGTQTVGDILYPKQLTSYSSQQIQFEGKRISKKSILGRYMRNRLNVSIDELITYETLEKYGRTTISLSLIEEGVYYADFSV
ncbi:restriction endonuclease PLD domain-containing protein [Enterococcus sp. 1001283B150225_161107_E12]|uniref:restriction endonuclease PLD domain-containing protein n=1 Tax=Enterococcus sp. 1001283B150225_161107_E12 TaxID=2787145 RepID=UPI00189C676F|nr:restriction endonuclease PLD domain-containing protein [Enterococcus sp. 1001283B150225_161107_E12]